MKICQELQLFWIFSFWQMLWKIIKKLIIICISFIFNLSSSSSKLYISRIVAFTEISMIRFQSWEHNKKPLNIWLVIASHVQLERSLNCFLDFIITLNNSLLKIWNSLEPPFFFLLKSLFHGLKHEVFEWRFWTRLQSNFIIHRNPDLVILNQLNVLNCINGTVIGHI